MGARVSNIEENELQKLWYGLPDTNQAVRVKDLDSTAADLIGKTQKVMSQLPISTSTPKSLVGRVETESPTPSPKEQLLAMDPQILRKMDKALDEIPDEPNYLIKVQNLIGKILEQFIKIGESDRVKKEDQKNKYHKATKEWGLFQKEAGDRGLNFTWIALGLMVSQFAFPQADREIITFLSKEGCTNLSNMFNSETQARQKQVDAIGQLAYSEISAMMNKGSSDSNKQEFINLLDKVYDSLRRAAQAG